MNAEFSINLARAVQLPIPPADIDGDMVSALPKIVERPDPLPRREIESLLKGCPRLPSLRSIDSALRELLNADQRYTSQISEVIRRDPSLTARLLRLVNSVYYGLTTPVNSIEEAVFYLGVRQIRQLAMATPVIEDFQRLVGATRFPWREFWQHCVATAIVSREVAANFSPVEDDADYVSGLVHDVGKIVIASLFPKHFAAIYAPDNEPRDLLSLEREILGADHAELGAIYLKQHGLPDVLIEAARHHHSPAEAGPHAPVVAAVHIADLIVRNAAIGFSGQHVAVSVEDWTDSPAWQILIPEDPENTRAQICETLKRSVERLPSIVSGLV